jgi:hypothetical protein
MPPLSIEQIVLEHGHRGMDRLARYLPADYAYRAANALWANRTRVLITTGFFVGGRAETDGPPGAFFLGRALARCGASVGFACEEEHLRLLRVLAESLWREEGDGPSVPAPEFFEFPVADEDASNTLARQITSSWQPTAVVAVERCGRTWSGRYRNIRGEDIREWTAQVDELFDYAPAVSVGIGDGGNELGMGALSGYLAELGIEDPVATSVDYLVVAAVSNWGAYGVVAYLSQLAGRDLLPTDAEESLALDLLVLNGAVDGMTGKAEAIVDGFPLGTDLGVLGKLRGVIGFVDQ